MQAIQTRVIPATDTKPTRIKAQCARGSLYFSTTHLTVHVGSAEAHAEAARALCGKFISEDVKTYGEKAKAGNPWAKPFVSGCLPSGDFAHVFLPS